MWSGYKERGMGVINWYIVFGRKKNYFLNFCLWLFLFLYRKRNFFCWRCSFTVIAFWFRLLVFILVHKTKRKLFLVVSNNNKKTFYVLCWRKTKFRNYQKLKYSFILNISWPSFIDRIQYKVYLINQFISIYH